MAVCIGTDTFVGVFSGVLFSRPPLELTRGGVLLIASSFCHKSSCFLFRSSIFAAVDFGGVTGVAEAIGENGFRILPSSASRVFDNLEGFCFAVVPARLAPLL